jgi:hypothetical protein
VPIAALLIVGLMIAWGDGHPRLIMRQLATIGVLASWVVDKRGQNR